VSAVARLGATVAGAVVAGLLGFLIVLYGAFAGGYVASQVWAWHLLPLGLGLPVLGWKHFWAIGAVVRLCFGFRAPETDAEKPKDKRKIAGAIVGPWLILAFAWWLKP
jgi:hypothetical protein